MDVITRIILNILKNQLSGWSDGSIMEQRARQERSVRFLRLPKNITTQNITEMDVSAEWIESPSSGSGIILYLHGGAYALGSINSHRALIANLVIHTICRALAIDYRLAPENPFPAALHDSLKTYDWLLKKGHDPSQICYAGDSAGGGLAISSVLAIREKGLPLPAGIFCISPWLDLTLSGDSITENENVDPILSAAILNKYVDYYIGQYQANDPLISPLFADLRSLPPILIQTGRNEILLDDSVRFMENAKKAEVDITMDIYDEMFHVFQLFSFLPATQECLKQVSRFVSRIIPTSIN